jgi:crossover junction endodeoxyribonuclease RusA
MSVEIRFPVEFVVRGTPVSLQTKNPRAIEAWKRRVRDASLDALPEGHFQSEGDRFAVTILHFPASTMQGDIIKPILDAMSQHIYADDQYVERIWVQRIRPGERVPFHAPSPALQIALHGPGPITYIRVSDDPLERLP